MFEPDDVNIILPTHRDDVVRMLLDVFTAASKPSTKTGFVRDALVAGCVTIRSDDLNGLCEGCPINHPVLFKWALLGMRGWQGGLVIMVSVQHASL